MNADMLEKRILPLNTEAIHCDNLPLFSFPVVLHIQRAGHKDHFVLGSPSLVRLEVLLVLQIGDVRQRDCHDIKNYRSKPREMRSKGCSGDQ